MDRKIIALAGEAGSGKDTFAQPLLRANWNHGSFAANLKKMCQQVFSLSPTLTDTQEGKIKSLDVPRTFTDRHLTQIVRWIDNTHDLTNCQELISGIKKEYILDPLITTGRVKSFRSAREILQFVGTEVCRRICPEYHVDVLIMKIEQTPGNWIITDARFPNERKALKEKFGAQLILIKRPGIQSIAPVHASETSLGVDDEYDVVFINDKTIEHVHAEAKRYL